ncbi:MAG: STAS domain-containing protein [Candidatus Omnitrophica bacterium]|nr:STAS domain-containing protein [Candidatus Omnitrophota bacterium]
MAADFLRPSFIAKEEGHLIYIQMSGDINQQTLPESRRLLDEIVRLHRINERDNLRILVDYKLVGDVDSSTLANIIERLDRNQNRNHRVAFINIPKEFQQLLEIYKLQEKILVFASKEEALRELQK